MYSNTNELLAVQQINNNNRLGGLGIYGNAGSNDIQALSKTLQAQLAALTAKLDSTIKTDANALKGIKSDNTDNTNTVAVAGGTPGVTY